MRLVVLAIAGMVAAPSWARAQQAVQLSVSLGSESARDDLLIPLAFTGPALGIGVRHAVASGPHRIDAELVLGIGVLESRFGQAAEQLTHGLAAGYRRQVRGHLEVGGVLRWHDEMSYLESWDDAHGYWLSQLGLAASARDRWRVTDRLGVEARAELVLVALASRPEMGRTNKQDALTHVTFHLDRIADDPSLVSILDLQALRVEAMARRRGSGVGLGVAASLTRAADPAPYTLLVVQATAAYAWGW